MAEGGLNHMIQTDERLLFEEKHSILYLHRRRWNEGKKWTQGRVGDTYIISEEEILTMRLNCATPLKNSHVEALNPQHLRMELYLEIESLKRCLS